MWQDIVLMFGGFVFAIALVPSVIKRTPPELSTCLCTAITLLAFVGAYFTLYLYLAAGTTLATSIAWFVLLVQRLQINRKRAIYEKNTTSR